MELAKVLNDINERKNKIEEKYNRLIQNLRQIEQDINDIPIKYAKNTKQFQEEKRQVLLRKYKEMEGALVKWKDNQIQKAEAWLIKQQELIVNEIDKEKKELEAKRNKFKVEDEYSKTKG